MTFQVNLKISKIIKYLFLDKETFKNAAKWICEVRKEREYDVKIFLLGNKSDL